MAAFLGVNIGVAATLATQEVGMRPFCVLSIIRLRSSEISQTEVGLLLRGPVHQPGAGLSSTPLITAVAVILAIVAVLALADFCWFTARSTTQEVMVERAITDRAELVAHLEATLGARVMDVKVIRLDCVNDTTWVTVHLDARPAQNSGCPLAAHPEMAGLA